MGITRWILVDSLVVLLCTATVANKNKGCWSRNSYERHYNCTGNNFGNLSIKNLYRYETYRYNKLRYLYLASNNITYVEVDVFHPLHNLNYLVLSSNSIRSLDEGVFSNLTSLLLLDLSFNLLSELSDGLFSSQKHLRTLILDGNNLTTITESMLIPLRSVTWLGLSENPFHCDCKLRLAVLWCKANMLSTKATCQDQLSGYSLRWDELEFHKNCSKNQAPNVLSESATELMNLDVNMAADTPYYVISLFTVGAVTLQFILFCLFLIYVRRQRRTSVGTAGKERSMHSDSSSVHDLQYDYIQISNMCKPPQLAARPTRTTENLGRSQVHACHSGAHLKEPALSGTNTFSDRFQRIYQMTEPRGSTSDSNNHQALRSEIFPTSVSFVPPVYEDPSKMAVSNGIINNNPSDTGVLVENTLYSLVDTPK